MKRFIRYLYEYEQGMRSRNVGFVKVEQEDTESIIHIHGKGLRMSSGDSLSLYLFYEEDKRFIKILQGEIVSAGPAINYRFRYTPDDVGVKENYDKIDGILLVSPQGRKFAAVWNAEFPVDVENMTLWQEAMERLSEEPPVTEEEQPPEMTPEQMPEVPVPEQTEQMPEMSVPEQMEQIPEVPVPEQMEQTPEVTPEGPDSAEEMESSEVSLDSFSGAERPESQWKATKIQRREISMLPRCEWRIANNNFLMHGYYNYRHLVLIDNGKILKLGVPGIYHEKEAKAAEAFGFPEFIDRKETNLTLNPEECNEKERFGYWCRQVRRPVM